MKSFEYTITDELGIHTRPAGALNKMLRGYQCEVRLKKGEKQIDPSQLIQLMLLGVNQGERVILTFEGEDEEPAYEAVKQFFQENL